jgi:hypothetical protein
MIVETRAARADLWVRSSSLSRFEHCFKRSSTKTSTKASVFIIAHL